MEQKKLTSKAARQMALIGAPKGGRARASVLTPEERSDIARRAVQARWRKAGKVIPDDETPGGANSGNSAPAPAAPASGEPGPSLPYSMFRGTLKIGDVEIECHVLNDGRRVLTQREVVRVLSGGRESGNLARYLDRNPLAPKGMSEQTIQFQIPSTGIVGTGYEGTLLLDLCDSYLDARDKKLLRPSQFKLAKTAEAVVRACAKVGIIALIDEATGFQEVRAKNALRLKLQAFIADELQEWARMFPDEFWYELARLEGVHYSPRSRPLRWGKYIMKFVYDAIDKDIGNKLRELNPDPHYRRNHHQWLKDFGRDKVHDQITKVVTIMKLCRNMDEFDEQFKKVFRKGPMQASFDDIDWSLS